MSGEGVRALSFDGGFVPAFVLTWLIESIVYLLAFRSLGWLGPRLGVGSALLLVLGLNVATHPLLWLFTSTVSGLAPLLGVEALAVIVEGALLALLIGRLRVEGAPRWPWAFLAALLANAVSLLIGLAAVTPLLSALSVAGSSACC